VPNCSKACGYATKTSNALVQKLCKVCGKPFMSQPYRNVKCCSYECNLKTRSTKKNIHGPDGWHVQSKTGYIVRSRFGRTQLQHRKVAEDMLGRPLHDFENVHHKNGIRDDNRPENLEVWITRPRPGQRPEDLIDWCIAVLEHRGYKVIAPSGAASAS
jgi:hypothetical protein